VGDGFRSMRHPGPADREPVLDQRHPREALTDDLATHFARLEEGRSCTSEVVV